MLLLWNLGAAALWQDEAATAVLAQRLLQHGRPLGYDGRNLLTMDHAAAEAGYEGRTADAAAAVRHYVARGDFRADTTWTGQPWGQFVVAGLSLAALGESTFAARLPFALAGLATLALLGRFATRTFGEARLGAIAAALLLANVYWLLHARQSRYYALSPLMVLLALMAWTRWQRGGRHGAALFVAAGWGLFQVDYGAFWPVCGVLLLEAGRPLRERGREALVAGAALAAAVLPFAVSYRLLGRLQVPAQEPAARLLGAVFNVNQYVVPLAVLVAAVLPWSCRMLPPLARRVVRVSALVVAATLLWVPAVAPRAFHRYLVHLSPLGALLGAVVAVRLGRALAARHAGSAAWAVAGVLALTPAAPALAAWAIPARHRPVPRPFAPLRSELRLLGERILAPPPDATHALVAWLRPRLGPADELLVSYEDIPFMFYTESAVRGGIPAFRVEDPRGAPRFAVLLRVPFVHWPVFERALARHAWRPAAVALPPLLWHNPDPAFQEGRRAAPPLAVLERVDSAPPR